MTTVRSVGALVALSLSAFTYVTTETLPIGLLTPIADDLGVSTSAVGLLVTAYGLVVVVGSLPLTALTQRLPRRALMTGLLGVLVVTTVLSALAPNYPLLLAARMLTALGQALFWSLVIPTTAGLFATRWRGRVIGIVMAGATLATVLGVPAATWLGQHTGWRVSMLAMGGLGLVAMLGIARLLPAAATTTRTTAPRGETPDPRRYALLLTTTALAVTGAFVSFTFITPYLTDVAGFSASAIGPLLLIRGLAALAGLAGGGYLADRSPFAAMIAAVALQAVALLGLYVAGTRPIPVAVLFGAFGLAFAALTATLGGRVLAVAPGSVDLASAGSSTAFNVGITLGALIGSVALPAFGLRSIALIGGLLSLAALGTAFCEPFLRRPPDPAADQADLPAPRLRAT